MDQEHLSQEEMLLFTRGLLASHRADAVKTHLQVCAACHQQQTQMAMAAVLAKMKEISEINQEWTCTDPFWGPPYPYAPVTPPPSPQEIREWEAKHNLRLPATLARALGTQNGGSVRDTDIIICPLPKATDNAPESVHDLPPRGFQLLSEPRWDPVFRFNQIVWERDKLLYIGDFLTGSIILNYAHSSEPTVVILWHDLGDELREEAESFEAFLSSARDNPAEIT